MHHWITIIQLTCTLLPESSAEYTILKIHFWAALQTLSRHDKFFISCLDKGDTLKLLNNGWCREQLTFYLLISEIGRKLTCYVNKKTIKEINSYTDLIAFEVYSLYVIKGGKKSDLVLNLLKDAFFQYVKMSNWDGLEESYNDTFYYKTMAASDSLIFDVNCYCNVTNDINMYSDSDDDDDSFSLDYYSDLYLFELLNSKLKVK